MKKKIQILTLALTASLLFPLVSCDNNTTSSRWEFTDEDIENIEEGTAYEYYNQGSICLTLGYAEPVITKAITPDDVKIINKSQLEANSEGTENYTGNYINKIIQNYSIAATDIYCDDTLTDVQIQFTGTMKEEYALLINKDVTTDGVYVLLEAEDTTSNSSGYYDPSIAFEQTYCSQQFSWGRDGKFIKELISNIATATSSMVSGKVTSAIGGLGSIYTSIKKELASNEEVTLADTLNTINQKIDDISNSLTKNFNLLQNEAIKTQLKVDQGILLQYQQAITDFNTNYIYPVNNFNTYMSNWMCSTIKDMVNAGSKTLDLWFYKDSENNWALSTISEINKATMSQVSFPISSFNNSKDFLNDNNQTIKDGFNVALEKDIQKASESVSTLDGMTAEELCSAAYANFMEAVMEKYFTENTSKSTELEVLLENETAAIYGGGIGTKSIIDSYVERLKYMYNFNGELQSVIQTIFSKILYQLDNATALASLGLGYNHLDTSTLATKYKTARNYVQTTYSGIAEHNANYCYTTSCDLTGEFYAYQYTPTYTNIGNNPSLTIRSDLQIYVKRPGWLGQNYNLFTTITDQTIMERHNWLDYDSLKIMSTRYSLLVDAGLVSSSKEFIDYLHENGALSDNAIKACRKQSVNNRKYKLYNRIFTGVSNERNLNASDTSYQVRCAARGNSHASYFETSYSYKYADSHGSNHWKGHLQETKYFDGTNGSVLSDTYLALWATFDESHWYWTNDEHWAFTGLDSIHQAQTSFFGINKA